MAVQVRREITISGGVSFMRSSTAIRLILSMLMSSEAVVEELFDRIDIFDVELVRPRLEQLWKSIGVAEKLEAISR